MTAPDPRLQALIASGSATLARAWTVTLRDGRRVGFTDHDRDLVVDGVTCRADTGAVGSAARQRLGLTVDRLDLRGALDGAQVSDTEVAAGLWRGAAVDIWLVDWRQADADPAAADPWRMDRALVGEIRRRGKAWVMELSQRTALLNQRKGDVISTGCPLVLGGPVCGVDLSLPAFRSAVVVTAVRDRRRLAVAGLEARPDTWAARGMLVFDAAPGGGANAGRSIDIVRHQGGEIALADPPPFTPSAGDTGVVTAGCAHTPTHCRDKFANGENFGGDPFAVTEGEFLALPDDKAQLDGGSLRR